MNGHSVFLRAEKGPFKCDNCEYYMKGDYACYNKNLIRDVKARTKGTEKLKINPAGHVAEINRGDCCDYFEKL